MEFVAARLPALVAFGRRLLRRRRVLTASSVVAVIAVVALVVGVTGVLGTGRKASEPPLAAPPTGAPVSGLALGIDQAGRFVLKDLARPATARVLSLAPGASGQVRAAGIAANPGQGWIVAYTLTGAGGTEAATTRFAVVDLSGAMHPFGPGFPTSADVGFAVAPDGSRIALLEAAASGSTPPKIRVMPLPGHAGVSRQWNVQDPFFSEIKDLSWAPDSRRLTYIAGTDTGAGMGGNPSTLDTSAPGDTVPTSSAPTTKADCQVFAGTWLGTTGRYGAIAECPGPGGMPETHFIEIDPITARLIHLGPRLPAYGCNGNDISSNSDASRILLYHCDKWYLLASGRLTTTSRAAFVPAGNSRTLRS